MAAEFVHEYPEMKPWIDTYEIVGGDSLLEKIAEGMDDAEKFVVFLSDTSVRKPWVGRELRRAIVHEISGIKPDYIVPVLLTDIETVPPFLEEKKYVPIFKLTRAEWLLELKASITGAFDDKPLVRVPNLDVVTSADENRPNVGTVLFKARSWAVDASFLVITNEKAAAYGHVWRKGGTGAWSSWHTAHGNRTDGTFYVAYAVPGARILPGDEFAIRVRFAPGVHFLNAVAGYEEWDGSGGFNTTLGGTRDADPIGFETYPGVDAPDTWAVKWDQA